MFNRWAGDTGILQDDNAAHWGAKAKGLNAWSDAWGASKSAVACDIWKRHGKLWRQAISVKPEVRQRERVLARELRTEARARDAPWPTCSGNADAWVHLGSLKEPGDAVIKKSTRKKKGTGAEDEEDLDG